MGTRFIDKYEIISTLGRGSMGVVYKGRDPEIGRLVAIKTMKSVFMGDDPAGAEALQRFRLESRSAGKLQHPNIVTIFEAGRTESGFPFIAMEYIDGRSLELILKENGPLDPLGVIHYLAQIAGAIDYAHSQSVIHRDIKPSNILVDSRHRAHLLDFGVAKLSDSSLTPAGTVVGTPSYMSPEQIRGAKLDGRTDLFSLAVVAFESLTGIRPFPGNDFTTVVSSIIHKQPLSFSEIGTDLPPSVEAALRRGLAKDREQRLPDALSFIDDLAQAFGVMVDGQGIAGGYTPPEPSYSSLSSDSGTQWRQAADSTRMTGSFEQFSDSSVLAEDVDNPGISPEVASSAENFDAAEAKAALSQEKQPQGRIAPAPPRRPLAKGAKGGRGKAVIAGFSAAVLFGLGLFGFKLTGSWFSPSSSSATGEGSINQPQGTSLSAGVRTQGGEESLKPEAGESETITSLAHVEAIFSGEIDRAALEKMNDSELRGVLISPNADADALVLALEEVGRRSALSFMPILHSLLEHSHFKVRISVLKLFDQPELLQRPEVVPNLINRLSDEDNLVRGYAAKILGGADRDEVRAALALRTKVETDRVVQQVLAQSIKRLQND